MMMRLLALPAAALLGGVAYFLLGASAPTTMIPYTDARRIASGKAVYADHCAACHGVDLEGQPNWEYPDADGYMPAPPQDGSGHTHDHSDLILFQTVKLGPEATVCTNRNSRMGGYAEILSDDEIYDVLAFIKSTWPRDLIARHEMVNGRPPTD